jgi:hypothetical protein
MSVLSRLDQGQLLQSLAKAAPALQQSAKQLLECLDVLVGRDAAAGAVQQQRSQLDTGSSSSSAEQQQQQQQQLQQSRLDTGSSSSSVEQQRQQSGLESGGSSNVEQEQQQQQQQQHSQLLSGSSSSNVNEQQIADLSAIRSTLSELMTNKMSHMIDGCRYLQGLLASVSGSSGSSTDGVDLDKQLVTLYLELLQVVPQK